MRVMLAGPIKHWWDAYCPIDLEHYTPGAPDRCPKCGVQGWLVWDTDLHRVYVAWRDAMSAALIKEGHLVYRPHEAFKGEWFANGGEEFAQRVNDKAIELSDVVLDLTPHGVPSVGTDEEREFASTVGVLWLSEAPPDRESLIVKDATAVARHLGAIVETYRDRARSRA